MKIIYTLIIAVVFFQSTSRAQYVTITDANFRTFLKNKYPSCFNVGGQMDTTCTTIVNEDSLDISNQVWTDLKSLKYFKNLRYLLMVNVAQNTSWSLFKSTTLELPDNIEYLDMSNNKINLWYTVYQSPITYAYTYSIFTKFPSHLKTLKCNNIDITNGNTNADTYLGNCDIKLPNIPNGVEVLEYSFTNQVSGNCNGFSGPKSLWAFNTTILPTNLRVLKTEKLIAYDTYNWPNSYETLPDTILPTSLKILECKNCYASQYHNDENFLSKIFNKNNVPNLDSLSIPNSKSLIKYLPASLKYLDMHETAYAYDYQYAFNNNKILNQLTLDSLVYCNLDYSSNTNIALNVKQLKQFVLNQGKLLTQISLTSDSLITFATTNCDILDSLSIASNGMKKFILNTYGTNISTFKIDGNSLDSLLITNSNTLKNIDLPYNTLKYLSISNISKLTTLSINSNSLLTALINSNNSLQNVNINSNSIITSQINQNNSLQSINLNSNSILNFDPSNNNILNTLSIKSNSLKKYSVSNYYPLKNLFISGANFDSLTISNNYNLFNLSLPYDTLKYLDINKNQALTSLNINSNSLLTTLINLNDALQSISLNSNSILTSQINQNNSLQSINLNSNSLQNFAPESNTALRKLSVASSSILRLNPYLNIVLDSLFINTSSLKYLNCSKNAIKYWTPLPNSLDTLIADTNYLSSLTNLANNIKYISCKNNLIANHTLLPTSLKYLDCSNNLLKTLSNLPNTLEYLDCNTMTKDIYTQQPQLGNITNIPTSLKYFDCSNNSLVYLPAINTTLKKFFCKKNLLHTLPSLPSTLERLDCSDNYFLTSLPPLSPVLDSLDCSLNNITRLPNLPQSLHYLNCSINALSYLPELPNNLENLYCWNNDLYCLPKLPTTLQNFWVSTLHITCMPNTINCPVTEAHQTGNYSYFGALIIPPPLCNPANNANQCKFKPVMQGTIFYDANSNGVKDLNEFYSKNVKVQLSNGTYTFTNNSGFYELTADSVGDYKIKIIAPQYYKAAPDTFSYTFTNYSGVETELIPLQPTASKDSMSISITPWQNCARPGSGFDYIINYENLGTTIVNPVIVLNYNNILIDYVKSSNPNIINGSGSLTLNLNNIAPGQTGGFTSSFTIKTTTTLGDSIKALTTITAATSVSSDSTKSIVKSSFDPNDKQATLVLTPLQVALGKDIDYTIRFQNTGTDTAFNIVIADTLNSQLQHNTLQMVGSSHNCKATVKDSIVYFEFFKINLPDSNVNKLKSHGYVSFKIKPVNSLVNGDIVPNKAYNYFDYNAGIATNTANTYISSSGVITPLSITNYQLEITNEKLVNNIWSTVNEINVSHFNIERSLNGKDFILIGKIAANNNKTNTYNFIDKQASNYQYINTLFYRLQSVDKDGKMAYSQIKTITISDKIQAISIYPNPAANDIYVTRKNTSKETLFITDIFGRIVHQEIISTNFNRINIQNLKPGVYVLNFENGEKIKLVKE